MRALQRLTQCIIIMDQNLKLKLKLAGGAFLLFATGALAAFIRETAKPRRNKILSALRELKSAIEHHFYECKPEEVANKLEDKGFYVDMFVDIVKDFCNIPEIVKTLAANPLFNPPNPNFILELFNKDYASIYLRQNSLDSVFRLLQNTTKDIVLILNSQLNLPPSTQDFFEVIFIAFIGLIQQLEEILLDLNQRHKLVQSNFYFSLILEFLEGSLKEKPQLSFLVGEALIAKATSQQYPFKFGHECQDQYYSKKVTDLNANEECQCTVFDLIARYSSIITPTLQKRFITTLVDYQVFKTHDQLVSLGHTILNNSFYLNSQLSVDSMYYVSDVSVLNQLLIQSLAHPSVRLEIAQNHFEALEVYFLYLERVITQNDAKFLSKLLAALISSHAMAYQLFADNDCLERLLANEKRITSITVHLLGILLIIETRETYSVDGKGENPQMIQWLGQNVDTLLGGEIISYLQLQFLLPIMKSKKENTLQQLMKSYLQCLRVVQNKRIQARSHQKKAFEVSASLTKLMGYLVLGFSNARLDRNGFDAVIKHLPFQEESERFNVFTNSLRILYDLPTMNLHFLKFIQPVCQNISQQALMSFHGYFTHTLSAQTVSFDTYMFTLQLGVLFGKPEILLQEIGNRLGRDFREFETYKDFLTRDIILLVDVIENPYYCMNILLQQGQKVDPDVENSLIKRAVISILKLNKSMELNELKETLSLFVHVKEITPAIMELLDQQIDGKYKLRDQYKLNEAYMCLQKDMESVNLYLKETADPFDELIYAPETFPFLKEIRAMVFRSQSFLKLIHSCTENQHRAELSVWIAKLLFHAKQTLVQGGQGANPQLEELLQQESVKSFKDVIQKHEKLVKYLEM